MGSKKTFQKAPVLKTSDLVKRGQVGRNTIRFYETKGLLEKPSRGENGYRVFSIDALTDLQFIKQAKSAGLSLEEIKELLVQERNASATCGMVSAKVEKKVKEIDLLITQLGQKRRFLQKFLSVCRTQESMSKCKIIRKGFLGTACCP